MSAYSVVVRIVVRIVVFVADRRLTPASSTRDSYSNDGSGGRTRTDNLAVNSCTVNRPLRSARVRLNTDRGPQNPLSAAEVRQDSPALLSKIGLPLYLPGPVTLRSPVQHVSLAALTQLQPGPHVVVVIS